MKFLPVENSGEKLRNTLKAKQLHITSREERNLKPQTAPPEPLEVLLLVPVQRQENENENGKRPQRGTAIGQQRQGNANNGH